MSFFAQVTVASHKHDRGIVSLILAAIFIVMAVAQLFTFEDFPEVIMGMDLPGTGEIAAKIQAVIIVTLEIAALPYLLYMSMSLVGRVVSLVAGWLAAAWWTYASLWISITQPNVQNGGMLGATIETPSGWLMAGASLALAALVAWTAWSRWPFVRTLKK